MGSPGTRLRLLQRLLVDAFAPRSGRMSGRRTRAHRYRSPAVGPGRRRLRHPSCATRAGPSSTGLNQPPAACSTDWRRRPGRHPRHRETVARPLTAQPTGAPHRAARRSGSPVQYVFRGRNRDASLRVKAPEAGHRGLHEVVSSNVVRVAVDRWGQSGASGRSRGHCRR